MNENMKEEYIYHNGIAYATDEDEKKQMKQDKRKKRKQNQDYRFTGIQTIVCVLIIVGILLLKQFKGDLFVQVQKWYRENLENSILIDYDSTQVKREIFELFGKKDSAD